MSCLEYMIVKCLSYELVVDAGHIDYTGIITYSHEPCSLL